MPSEKKHVVKIYNPYYSNVLKQAVNGSSLFIFLIFLKNPDLSPSFSPHEPVQRPAIWMPPARGIHLQMFHESFTRGFFSVAEEIWPQLIYIYITLYAGTVMYSFPEYFILGWIGWIPANMWKHRMRLWRTCFLPGWSRPNLVTSYCMQHWSDESSF